MVFAKERLIALAQRQYMPSIVEVVDEGIERLPPPSGGYSGLPTWDWCVPSTTLASNKDGAMFLLALNSLNYMFWQRNDDGSVRRYFWCGKSGSSAMFEAFKSVWGSAQVPDILRQYELNEKWFSAHFGEIPAPIGRLQILEEVRAQDKLERAAEYLLRRVSDTGMLTTDDAEHITMIFPFSYGADPYLKKAQIAVSAVAGWLNGRGAAVRCETTAFADYQVPRVLRALGVLRYSGNLSDAIATGELVPSRSDEESAIRAATILAVERIARKHGVSSAEVDTALWCSQEVAAGDRFHLTLTTDY